MDFEIKAIGLEVEGIDVLNGTPLLDIKSYVADFDVRKSMLVKRG